MSTIFYLLIIPSLGKNSVYFSKFLNDHLHPITLGKSGPSISFTLLGSTIILFEMLDHRISVASRFWKPRL